MARHLGYRQRMSCNLHKSLLGIETHKPIPKTRNRHTLVATYTNPY